MSANRIAARIAVIATLLIPACASGWPPVVSNAADVEALPTTQREIRCIDCDDDTLVAVGQRLEQLDYLFINDRSTVTDRGIQSLALLQHLRQLVIGNATTITDASLRIIKQLPALRELSIDQASLLSGDALLDLAKGSKLSLLFVFGTRDLSAQTIERVRQQLPGADVRISD
jgi:hypothetical protein